jgi:hypothetical protein
MAAPIEDQGARKLAAVTASDTVALPNGVCRALWVGGAGNIAILAEDDAAAVTLSGVQAGTIIPVRTRRVNSTNTTATLIVALY